MKRITTTLLIATVLSMASAFAQSGSTGPLKWVLRNNTLTISGDGDMPDYAQAISVPWWQYKESIHSIVIEIGVKSIGEIAFSNCVNLTSVTIPNTVTRIGSMAFNGCKNLTSINIPISVISIKDFAFSGSSLSSINIPRSVTDIERAFFGCHSLISIDVEDENNTYASDQGVLYNKDKTTLLFCPQGKAGAYVTPNSVISIKNEAFYGCRNLTLVTITNGVTNIGYNAFFSCTNLTSVAIPNSVATIGSHAFSMCSNLASIHLPGNLTHIAPLTFGLSTNLASVTIPRSVTSIGFAAFHACTSLTSITSLNPVPPIVDVSFPEVDKNACTLYVPIESVLAYKNADEWKEFNIQGIEVDIEIIDADALKIYPNPTTGELQFAISDYSISNIEIFDVYGRIQKIGHISYIEKSHIVLDIAHLQTGIYFIKITTKQGEIIKKIIKQ